MQETYSSIIYRPAMTLLIHDGTFIGGPFELSESSDYRPVPVGRPRLIKALYDYTTSLGIPVTFGKRVSDYEESSETSRAYAITDKGERFGGDVVIAADGIGSKVGKVMIGKEIKAISSGFSAYRVTYPTNLLQADPFLAEQYPLRNGDPDYCEVYMSPQGQMITLISPELTTWLLTHKVRIGESLITIGLNANEYTGRRTGRRELVYATQCTRCARRPSKDRAPMGP